MINYLISFCQYSTSLKHTR